MPTEGLCPRCLLSLGLESPDDGVVPGRQIGHFQIIRELGRGGMGRVFLAFDTVLERPVALKFVVEERQGSPEAGRRLMGEARAAAALDHPYICHVHEVGTDGDTIFISMEYVEGETLAERIREGPLPLAEFGRLAGQILEAVEAAHLKGIIHGDLKPANIMVTPRGHVKVMDFGLARTVLAGASDLQTTARRKGGGTVAYMAPERLRGDSPDVRSDIFSLGVLCWEMLAGRHPFERSTALELARAIAEDEPDVPSGVKAPPGPLLRVLDRMLAKEPGQRDASVARVAARLRRALGLVVPGPSWWRRRLDGLLERRSLALPGVAVIAATVLALATRHFVTLSLSLAALAWMLARARSWKRLSPAMVAVQAVAVVVLLTAELGLHSVWAAQEQRRQVFVVLSFEKDRWQTERQLLEHITRSFRSTVETTFAALPSADVVVVPRAFDEHTFEQWSYETSRGRILEQIAYRPLPLELCRCFQTTEVPDLILRNYVSVQGGPVGSRNLILVTALNRLRHRDLLPTGERIRIEGGESEVRHLLLRAVWEFLLILRVDPEVRFTDDQEQVVKRRILGLYREFLSRIGETEGEAEVARVLASADIPDDWMAGLLEAHDSAFDPGSYRRSIDEARTSTLEKMTVGQ